MQKWPYAKLTHLSVEHFQFNPKRDDSPKKREYLTVEVVFPSASENSVMFFDHFAKEYRSKRSELDQYLERLAAEGWKLTLAGPVFEGKSYLFRRFDFRRTIE